MRRIKKASGVVALAGLTAAALLAPAADAVIGQVRSSVDTQLPTANNSPSRGKSGPNLAVNPTNPNHIVELHQELETEECEFNRSLDGGASWAGGELQAPTTGTPAYPLNLPGPCDVTGHGSNNIAQRSIAFGSGNNVYISWTANRQLGATGFTVLLSKSTDGGLTYPSTIEIPAMTSGLAPAPDFSRPEIVVDRRTPGTDRLFVSARDARNARALVVRSDDAGTTFGPAVEASNNNPATNPAPIFTGSTVTTAGNAFIGVRELTPPVLGAAPAGGGNRPLYVGWIAPRIGGGAGVCPPNCENVAESSTDSYVVVAKSTDLGVTWTRNRAINVRGFISPVGSLNQGSHFPQIEVGRTDDVYLTFNQGPDVPSSNNCGVGPFPSGAPGANAVTCPSYGPGSQRFQAADHFMNWDLDTWFLRSTNGGTSWSGLKQLNEPKKPGLAAPEITQTRHPLIAVAPDGRIDISWEDRRHWYLNPSDRKGAAGVNTSVNPSASSLDNYRCVHSHSACDEARLGDTYYTNSSDAGATFALSRRVNDRSHNNDIGYDYRFSIHWDYGAALVALGDSRMLVADMDTRLGNFDADSVDIFLRTVDLNAPAGAIPTTSLVSGGATDFSATLSQKVQPGGSEAVHGAGFTNRPVTRPVIVNNTDVPSALVGGVLARANLGPLLASPAGSLPANVKAEVDRINPVGAFVLGDTAKLSAGVVADLVAAGVPADQVTRISGTPAEMAATIAVTMDRRRAPDKALTPPLPAYDAVIIANPNDASATAASALAANRRLPILFVDQNAVPAITSSTISSLGVTKSIIVGSTDVVSSGVQSALPNATRLTGSGSGYRLTGADGSVYAFGNAGNFGSLAGVPLAKPVVGSASTPSGNGYWLVASDGGIFSFGDARFFGSTGGIRLDKPIVGMSATPSGNGYWLVASDGGIFAFGDARFFGSTGGIALDKPVVGMAATPSGNGYWLVASDGGIFAFGDARFFGSTGGIALDKPVVGMTPSASGNGYTLVASDGGIFNYGDAQFFGSTGGIALDKPITGVSLSPTGLGYQLVATDGGIFAFGDAVFFGSTGGTAIPAPIVGVSGSNKIGSVTELSNAIVTESVARGLPRNIVYVADSNKPMQAALLGAAVGRMGGLLMAIPGGTAASAETTINGLNLRAGVDRIVTSNLTGP